MDIPDIPEITEARRLTLRPGDALAIRLDYCPTEHEAHDIRSRVRDALGDKVPVLILEPGAEIGVIAVPQPDGAL